MARSRVMNRTQPGKPPALRITMRHRKDSGFIIRVTITSNWQPHWQAVLTTVRGPGPPPQAGCSCAAVEPRPCPRVGVRVVTQTIWRHARGWLGPSKLFFNVCPPVPIEVNYFNEIYFSIVAISTTSTKYFGLPRKLKSSSHEEYSARIEFSYINGAK